VNLFSKVTITVIVVAGVLVATSRRLIMICC